MKRMTTVLVANRGEIARRIFQTCREEGLRTAAVFTEVDRPLPFVQEADVAVCIGDGPAGPSYLDSTVIINAALKVGADAIHPGYGFLSENADFARAVTDAGLIWVGPPPESIDQMGDKTRARSIAKKHNVPIVPGFDASQEIDALIEAADTIGYPLLIKATAGGGGRGMRRVDEPSGLKVSLESARREAQSAFGNGDVFLEKFIENPRHIEVQIIADNHGNTLHLGERECSIQRRHQKVIEEAPSPAVDDALRERLGEAAIRMSQAVGYTGAGTVEFIMNAKGEFYFLEMNTRLQVEHPVTEQVTGLDLVALQLSVARGNALSFTQNDIQLKGHSIEARVYAEDPAREYAPGTGPLLRCRWPTGRGVRVDAGFEAGQTISPYYDAMLSKIVIWGDSRAQATERMQAALRHLWVVGPATNIPLLKDIFATQRWASGQLETGFLPLEGLPKPPPLNLDRGVIAATCLGWWLQRNHAPWGHQIPAGWRVSGPTWQSDVWQSFGTEAKVRWKAARDGIDISLQLDEAEPTLHQVRHICVDGDLLILELDGVQFRWQTCVDPAERRPSSILEDGDRVFVHLGDGEALVQLVPRLPAPSTGSDDPGTLTAATPGTVVKVMVEVGAQVKAGETLLVVEAMKMEQRLSAPADGTVTAVLVEQGDAVGQGDTLIRLECEES